MFLFRLRSECFRRLLGVGEVRLDFRDLGARRPQVGHLLFAAMLKLDQGVPHSVGKGDLLVELLVGQPALPVAAVPDAVAVHDRGHQFIAPRWARSLRQLSRLVAAPTPRRELPPSAKLSS